MRILIHASGSHGDVFPFIALAQEFQRRGHDARLYAPAVFADFARDANLPFKALGTIESYESLLHDPAIARPLGALKVAARGVDDTAHAAFMAMNDDVSEDTIIIGSTLAFAARSVAELHKLPVVTMHLAPSAIRSSHRASRFSARPARRAPPPFVQQALVFLADFLAIDPTIGAAVNRHRRTIGLPPVRRVFDSWMNQSNLVIGMFPDWFADPQPDWPFNLRLTDFPFYDHAEAQPLPSEVEDFLAAGQPPVAFTVGTANAGGHDFFAASVEACRRTGKRGILLTRYVDQIPDPLPRGIVQFNFVPLSQLLPRLAAFVHHGGVGTTSQAFRAGVPQLIRPVVFDQYDNSDRATRLGVAIELPSKGYDVENVVAAINRLTSDQSFRERCSELAVRTRTDGIAKTCDHVLAMT